MWGVLCLFCNTLLSVLSSNFNHLAVEERAGCFTGPLRVCNEEIVFLFLNKTCCGYSKESSQRDRSFEHPKHMLKLMGKKILTIFCSNILLI